MQAKTAHTRWARWAIVLAAGTCVAGRVTAAQTIWLDSLNLRTVQQGWGKPQADRSAAGTRLAIHGRHFKRGVSTRPDSVCRLKLAGATDKFSAWVGVDDAAGGPGPVIFRVIADGKIIFDSGVMRAGEPAKDVAVDLHGVQDLMLNVTAAGDGISRDLADWADARFRVSGVGPQPVAPWQLPATRLTPKPGPAPRINGPEVYGCRSGHPFIYRIPAQGRRPMRFSALGLPKGLKLDSHTGIITGVAPGPGSYRVTFVAANGYGSDQRPFKIVSGDKLALTPPMGWNDWYAYEGRITEKIMRQAADLMIRDGMADVGYQYVDVDDCWANAQHNSNPLRVGPFHDNNGNLIPNHYFPDMKGLAAHIHSKGLKAGLYSSPGPTTCAGCAGCYGHEAQDARQFADWGFDLLKYDWCSYGKVAGHPLTLAKMQQPYRLMGRLLREQDRDIVLNLCQYGMGGVWKWGASVGGQSWRTAGDLGPRLPHIFGAALENAKHRRWQKPGAWNDPDYIQIGWLAHGHCPLTPNEQYSFVSLWCLMGAPLIYSGKLSRLDPFTLNVLCNPEVIAVDQDPLGECARVVPLSHETFLMVKDLEDGAKAVGLCNRDEVAHRMVARWSDIGVTSKQPVRDLWREKDLGEFDGAFTAMVPPRSVVLIRVGKPTGRGSF